MEDADWGHKGSSVVTLALGLATKARSCEGVGQE